MMNRLRLSVLALLAASCGAEKPVAHTVRVEGTCGACGVVATTSEGTVFELDDGRLSLFTDFAVDTSRTAMLEVVGIGGPAPEVRYHEIEGGRVVFVGVVDAAVVSVTRVSEEARVDGLITLDVHDAETALPRSYTGIRVFPADTGMVAQTGGGGGGGAHGGGGRVNTQVVVVIQPTHPRYVADDGGCDGSGDSGGCEGDTYDSGGGCDGDTSGDASGCDGDSSSSSCEGSSSSGCEGDIAARSLFPPMFRLLWPVVTVGAWNRRRRRRLDQRDASE